MEGMNAVTNQPGGTAYAARILDPALAMGGKTGTAQVRHLAAGEHKIEGGRPTINCPGGCAAMACSSATPRFPRRASPAP
jgi:hypothetical protein